MTDTKREIKFRAFDKINKKFISQSITVDLEVTIRLDGIFVSDDGSIDGTESGDRIILSQFTGLLDKNGKEIYEGDVIINPYFISSECPHCDKPFYENKPEVVKWDRHDSRWSVPMIDMGQNYRILGNIYENPELIKE